MYTRRQTLALLATLTGLSLTRGCASFPMGGGNLPLPSPTFGPAMIDAHCHNFNARDLSPARFLRYAIMELYPDPQEVGILGTEDPDLFDGIIEVILAIVGAERAPSISAEIAYLDGRTKGDDIGLLAEAQLANTTENLARFLGRRPRALMDGEKTDYRRRGAAFVYFGVMGATPEALSLSDAPPNLATRRSIASMFLTGDAPMAAVLGRDIDLRQLFRWIGLFRQYRHVLIDNLVERHRAAKWNPVLLVPATVDFGRFVREEPREPLARQTAGWARISKRLGGPPVHGYVAFCPLRQALHQHSVYSRFRVNQPPLAVVETALQEQGFLGVKLYPPMGFQPTANAGRDFARYPFSDDVLRDRFGSKLPKEVLRSGSKQLAQEIDEALAALYDLCERLDAPIMAHGGRSNAVKRYYGEFSDPWLWRPVFETRRSRPLRVLLAHYGSFDEPSQDPAGCGMRCDDNPSPIPTERTKEAAILRYLQTAPDAPVCIDISFLSEVLTLSGSARDRIVQAFADFIAKGGEDHVVFGTDWIMLGIQKGDAGYDAAMIAFWRDANVTEIQAQKMLRTNFMKFAGLQRGEPTRQRLDTFNGTYGAPNRLAILDN